MALAAAGGAGLVAVATEPKNFLRSAPQALAEATDASQAMTYHFPCVGAPDPLMLPTPTSPIALPPPIPTNERPCVSKLWLAN